MWKEVKCSLYFNTDVHFLMHTFPFHCLLLFQFITVKVFFFVPLQMSITLQIIWIKSKCFCSYTILETSKIRVAQCFYCCNKARSFLTNVSWMHATVRVGVNNEPICLHNRPLVWVKSPFTPGLLTKNDESVFGTKVESDFPSVLQVTKNMHFVTVLCWVTFYTVSPSCTSLIFFLCYLKDIPLAAGQISTHKAATSEGAEGTEGANVSC